MRDVRVFDAVTEQWLPDAQRPPDLRWKAGRLAVVAAKGRLFAIGGFNGTSGAGEPSPAKIVSVYSPTTNTWDDFRGLMDQRYGHASVAAGNKILSIGGGTNTAEWLTLGSGPSACDIFEPDDTPAKASPWDIADHGAVDKPSIGAAMTQASLCAANDVDYFEIGSLALSDPFKIRLTPPPGADYELELRDLQGNLVARSANPGSVPEEVDFNQPLDALFRVIVRSQSGSFNRTTPYRLEIAP